MWEDYQGIINREFKQDCYGILFGVISTKL